MKIAAIDIGSNSIKLAVVEAAGSDSFAVLAREKETVRLGHETLTRKRLSAAAIGRAVDCIKRFRSIAEARRADHIICAATASVREANNAAAFVREVGRQTGVRVEVLPGVEEARLVGLAASRGCAGPRSSLLNIDIGGGSTEITLIRRRARGSTRQLARSASHSVRQSDPSGRRRCARCARIRRCSPPERELRRAGCSGRPEPPL